MAYKRFLGAVLTATVLCDAAQASCISSGNHETINSALSSGGAGAVVQLCPGASISISDTIRFTAAGQEISTQGYPTDATRATIQIAGGNSLATAIDGVGHDGAKLLNVQIDGNYDATGYIKGGDALISLGGGISTGQTVSHVASKNPRGWSCLHFIGSGNDSSPCRNGNITFNDIGPCGHEGNGHWADGISLDCTDTLVQNNKITGPTDGGIVIFGSPGSQILDNTITSSDTQLGFGAINMVDDLYGGSYANVVVSGNTIAGVGDGLFNLGIAVGNDVWSFQTPNPYKGPATITNNTFTGNVGFSIVVNGWTDGLTVTGNDVSGVKAPTSAFADASGCAAQVQQSFGANQQLIVYGPSVTGQQDLQSDFTSVPQNATNWLCLSHPLPSSLTIQAGSSPGVTAANGGVVANLHGLRVQLQGDGNLVGYSTSGGGGGSSVAWATGKFSNNCGSDGSQCQVILGGDGNFVEYDSKGPVWSTGTQGNEGDAITFLNASPWIQIKASDGRVIWTLADGVH